MLCRFSFRSTFPATSFGSRSFVTAAAPSVAEFPRFTTAEEISDFANTHFESLEPKAMASFFKHAVAQAARLPDGRSFRNSTGFKKAIATAVDTIVKEPNVNTSSILMGGISSCSTSYQVLPPCLKDAGEELLKMVTSRKLQLTPENFAPVIGSLVRLRAKDIALCSFVKEELKKHASSLSPFAARQLLRSTHDLNMREYEVKRLLFERMDQDIDQFNNSDVVHSLATFAHIEAVHPPVFKRCLDLLSQHVSLFDSAELVSASDSLVLLQSFPPRISVPVIEELRKNVRSLRIFDLSRLLNILCVALRVEGTFANEIIGILAASPTLRALSMEVNMAYAICTFNLQDRKSLLQTLINDILNKEKIPMSIMTKLVETIESASIDMGMRIEMPDTLKQQLDEFNSMPKMGIHSMLELFTRLPEKFGLSFESGVQVGPFFPALVDKTSHIVIEERQSSEAIRLRTHLYQKLGFEVVFVGKRYLRGKREDTDKVEYLKSRLGPALVKLGRMTKDEFESMRERRTLRTE